MTGWRIGIGLALAMGLGGAAAEAAVVDSAVISVIESADLFAAPSPLAGTGLGTFDLIMLAPSGGGSLNNPAGPLNFDNSNTNMPTGATAASNESYMTSIGELRDFYRLTFPDGSGGSTVDQLLLFATVQEAADPALTLDALDLIVNYSVPDGATAQDPAANDLTATVQNAANGSVDTGTGTRIVRLQAPLALTDAHASGADAIIATGWNPFDPSLADGTRLLVHWQGEGHDGAGETLFLSGLMGSDDLCTAATCGTPPPPVIDPGPDPEPVPEPAPGPSNPTAESPVPEPASIVLALIGLAGLAVQRRLA